MVAASFMSRLHPILDKTELTVENIWGATEGTRQAAYRLYSTCEEARDEINKAVECMSVDMTAVIEGAKGELNNVVNGASPLVAQTEGRNEGESYANGRRATYADALSRQLPSTHAGTLTRC